jgi:hypothetical protein
VRPSGKPLLGCILALHAVRTDQQVEARIEDVENEAPPRHEMAAGGREESQLVVDLGEMLHDAERRDDQGELRAKVEVPHVVLRKLDA